MQNDSIETLLLRHLGSTAPAPVDLEQRLHTMVRKETTAHQVQSQVASNWGQRRVSRRQILQLATFSSAGLGVLAVGAHSLETTLTSRSSGRAAYSL